MVEDVEWQVMPIITEINVNERLKEYLEKNKPKEIARYEENGKIIKVYEARVAASDHV